MKKIKLLTTVLLSFNIIFMSGCATVKQPNIESVNQQTGLVKLSYEYNFFEKPEVNWENANNTVNSQCNNWGYKPATKSYELKDECVSRKNSGKCAAHKVTADYQCELTSEQLAKLQAAEKKAFDEKEKLKKAQQAFLNSLSSFTEVVTCSDSGGGIQASGMANEVFGKYIKGDMKNYRFEIVSWSEYCNTKNRVLDKESVLERGKLISYNQHEAYFILTFTRARDGVDATVGIVAK